MNLQINVFVLTVILIILKMTAFPSMAWGWVFMPIWIGPALVLAILAGIGVLFVVYCAALLVFALVEFISHKIKGR